MNVALLGVLAATAPWVAGCDEYGCNAACAPAMPTVVQSATVVKVVADPPCTAEVALVDGGTQIVVLPRVQMVSGGVRCQVYEWLADDTELTAQAWFSPGDGPCCQYTYASGGISPFAPVASGAS